MGLDDTAASRPVGDILRGRLFGERGDGTSIHFGSGGDWASQSYFETIVGARGADVHDRGRSAMSTGGTMLNSDAGAVYAEAAQTVARQLAYMSM